MQIYIISLISANFEQEITESDQLESDATTLYPHRYATLPLLYLGLFSVPESKEERLKNVGTAIILCGYMFCHRKTYSLA